MPEHQVHWTALPRGAEGSHVELDVFISPRLGIDALAPEYVLDEFPELATWTARVAAGEVAFGVSFDGGPAVSATIVAQDPLDEDLWTHLFPSGSFVLPWSFRDHSPRTIRSFPVRWVTAYLRDVYREVGRASGPEVPSAGDLERIRKDLGGLVDTRVDEERNLATERPNPNAPQPHGPPQGCLTAIRGPLCRPLRRLCRWLRKLLGLGGAAPGPGGGPTAPGRPVPGSVEFLHRPPALRPTDPYEDIEAEVAAHGAVAPVPPADSKIARALESYPVSFAFAQVMRFYDRTEMQAKPVDHPDTGKALPSPAEPRWDFHRRIGALGDYPRLMQRLGLVIRIRAPRPVTTPQTVSVVPSVGGLVRPAVDIAPATACELKGERFHAKPRGGSDLVDGMLDLRGADDRLETTESIFDLVQIDADGAALKAINAAASLERRWQLFLKALGFTVPEPEPLPATRTAGIAIVRADRAWGLKLRLEGMRKQWLGHGNDDLYADEVVRGYQVWVRHGNERWRSLCERSGVYRLVDDAGALIDRRAIEDHGYVKRSGATSKDGSSDLYVHEALVRWAGWSLVAPLPGKTVAPRADPDTGATEPTSGEVEAAKVSRAVSGFRLETRFLPLPGSLPRLRFGESYRFAMAWVDLAGNPLAQLGEGPDGLGADARVSDEVEYRRFEPVAPPSVLPLTGFTPGGSLERLVVRSDFNRSPSQWLADVEPGPAYAEHDDRRLFAPKTSQQMAELHGRFDAAFGSHGDHSGAFALGAREKGTFEEPAIPSFGTPGKVGDTVVNSDADAVLVAPYLPDPIAAGIVLRGMPNLELAHGVRGDHLDVVAVPGVEGPVLRIPFDGRWPDIESVRIRLLGSGPGVAPHWNAAKRLLTIHLMKGAEADVLYSCYLDPADLDAMGAWSWLDDHDPLGELHQQAQQSIHWLIAPWRTLTLVHAVQHPLAEPELQPGVVATRVPSETFATVTGTATVDADSTSRVDLEASWEDWRDDVPGASELVKEPQAAAVGHWTFERGVPMPPQRHEFGDTRHRRVKYRLCAASRFREYLPAGTGLDLTRSGPELPVEVPASAPPDPPRISYAVPAFGWRLDAGPGGAVVLATGETLRRTRVGGGLRVFLERPWFSSGQGERLAVILKGPDTVPQALLSRIGIDPTVGESAWPENAELEPTMFMGANTEGSVLLSERQAQVAIASFEPSFDKGRQLWACDVTLDMTALPWGDWPFVRLALARHQPDAIDGAHLSKIELAQWAQLAPDRNLAVSRSASDHVTVELRGRGRMAPDPNRVVLGIERAAGASPDELDWRPAAGGPTPELDFELWRTGIEPQPDGDELLWHAVDVPVPPGPAGDSLRLTVWELERRPGEGEVGRGAFRITYADTVRLA
jgi:hypothetical protein